ncbi:hypothetical protein IAT38_000494 [Cryptococcus sp. DSM 104549]
MASSTGGTHDGPPNSIPIPASLSAMDIRANAIAGPSSEGALPRRKDSDAPAHAMSPSSAPPVASVIAVTHPSQFIHTHHPRRGSMTPLGLNVISPVAPITMREREGSFSPPRNVGFHPNYTPEQSFSPSAQSSRRDSATSTTSTLTLSRPANPPSAFPPAAAAAAGAMPQHSFFPPNWNPGRRRSSLTPSISALAPPSPTRAHASGYHSRPVSVDPAAGGLAPDMRLRTFTGDAPPDRPDLSFGGVKNDLLYARRGSLPHLGYRGWTGPAHRSWNPILPPSDGDAPSAASQLNEGFKFGSAGGVGGDGGAISPTTAAPPHVSVSPESESRRGSKRREDMDVFEQAEADEAERQRRAFLAATYGADGRRARERLSIGGQGSGPIGQGTPGGLRRQSLMLWERMGMWRSTAGEEGGGVGGGLTPLPLAMMGPSTPASQEDLGPRRGSLPIAIPGGGLGRSPSRREAREQAREMAREARGEGAGVPDIVTDDVSTPSAEHDEDDDEYDEAGEGLGQTLSPPKRPLPPLLPLSDPGPRLLPSTLALHRANHLLNSRNLTSEPLPHPLPPSLHPPDPVDITEFDIDFILAGSQAQLGGQGKKNAPVDVLGRGSGSSGSGLSGEGGASRLPASQTFKLGGDEEDTFAKFVGEFDDEYGGRRGEWTFRACPPLSHSAHAHAAYGQALASGQRSPRDPLDTSDGAIASHEVKAEWESTGAGKYELLANGEVRSSVTGKTWRVKKMGVREYELVEAKSVGGLGVPAVPGAQGERYTLAGKHVHRDQGGVKLPYFNINAFFPAASGSSNGPVNALRHKASPASKLRASMSETVMPNNHGRSSQPAPTAGRSDSDESGTTATPAALSQSVPFGSALKAKKREERGRALEGSSSKKRDGSRDLGVDAGEKKDGRGLSGVFKRGLLSSIKNSVSSSDKEEKRLAREERERERVQAHSWSGSSSSSGAHHHGSWSGSHAHAQAQAAGLERASDGTWYRAEPKRNASVAHGARAGSASAAAPWEEMNLPPLATALGDEENERRGPSWIAGKAWEGVPEDAVAMVIPLEGEASSNPGTPATPFSPSPFPVPLSATSSSHVTSTRPTADNPYPHPFFAEKRQAMLVWYVPFNSEYDDEPRPSTASSRTSTASGHTAGAGANDSTTHGNGFQSGSLPKFQKLLRRRASKDKDALKGGPVNAPPSGGNVPMPQSPGAKSSTGAPGSTFQAMGMKRIPSVQPLPFRSFRVVARVVDSRDLRSRVAGAGEAGSEGKEEAFDWPKDTNVFVQPPTPVDSPDNAASAVGEESGEPAIPEGFNGPSPDLLTQPPVPTGRNFPTVIAVCHSRSQGVEFVLEGLDRLGLCKGESAWGPTGYEEWRGTGLSDYGRSLVDLLWAGCTGVMGLTGV